jgi:hypothetical protein
MSQASHEAPPASGPFHDQHDYRPLSPSPDPFDDQSRCPSSDPFAAKGDCDSRFTVNLQGTSDPFKAFTDSKEIMQKVVPGVDFTSDGGLTKIQIPDDYIIERKSQHDLDHMTEQDDVCAISIAASDTGDTSIGGNDTAFAVPWAIAKTLRVYDEVGHLLGSKRNPGQLLLFPTDHFTAQSKATGLGTVDERAGPNKEYSFASLKSRAWAGRE